MGNEVSVCQEPSGPHGDGASRPLLSVSISSLQTPVMSEDDPPSLHPTRPGTGVMQALRIALSDS